MAVSKRLRFEILRRDNHACRYCGRSAPEVALTVDHVVPVALGGDDKPENLVAACQDCNGGKSSVPVDTAAVADVASDALRWAAAMQQAATERASKRAAQSEIHDAFIAKWNDWTYEYKGQRRTIDISPSWERSIDQFLDAGLEMVDLHELVDVAMRARTTDEWRYFCGCCWRRIREMQDRAAQIVSQSASAPEGLFSTVRTRWTQHHIDGYLGARGYGACELHPPEEAEECAADVLCHVVARAADVERVLIESTRDWKQRLRDELICVAADESEDYVYG